METNNVVVLSSDGKNCRQILSKSDGLHEPYSLRINIDRGELLVCENMDVEIVRWVYNITKQKVSPS
jgi:hypothetical protein